MSVECAYCVYETFSSLQGESTFAGLPCFFIRFASCNLRCRYCDTKKAWTADAGRLMTCAELLALALESGLKLVELTGGEPLFRAGVPELARELIGSGKTVLVETNGSVDVSVLPREVHRIIDWKTPSSGEQDHMFEPNFRHLQPHDEVKFVISDEADYRYAAAKIAEFRMAEQTENLLFSPAWGKMELKELAGWILRDRLPVRCNLQLHKIIWGAETEGV